MRSPSRWVYRNHGRFGLLGAHTSRYERTSDMFAKNAGPVMVGHAVRSATGVVFAVLFFASISRVATGWVHETTNLSWALAYLALFLAVLMHLGTYVRIAGDNILLILAAFMAMFSALWSPVPELSASRGLLLILNIMVGFFIYEQLGLRRTIILIFWFGFIVQGISFAVLLAGQPVALDELGKYKGLYMHRNNASMHAVLLYLTGWLLFAEGWRRPIAAVGILLSIATVTLTQSGSALVIITVVSGLLAVRWCFSIGWRVVLVAAALVLLTALLFLGMAVFTKVSIGTIVLELLGKDPTISGRTVLWEQAVQSFNERPWYGLGYNSFWNSPDTPARVIWFVLGQKLHSFHNSYLDILVDLGLIGFGFFVMGFFVIILRASAFFTSSTPVAAWPLTYCVFLGSYAFSEYPMFWNNEFQLLLAFCAAAVSPKSDPLMVQN